MERGAEREEREGCDGNWLGEACDGKEPASRGRRGELAGAAAGEEDGGGIPAHDGDPSAEGEEAQAAHALLAEARCCLEGRVEDCLLSGAVRQGVGAVSVGGSLEGIEFSRSGYTAGGCIASVS